MKYQAVIFDFDYTLGDDTAAIYAGFVYGMTQMGYPKPTVDQVRHTVGFQLEESFTRLTGDNQPERQQAFRKLFISEARSVRMAPTPLCPGAKELVLALHEAGITLALVSTKDSDALHRIMAHHGLDDKLSLVVGGDMVSRPKPDPEGLNFAMAKLGLDPEQVLFCGDTVIDAKTAQGAGVDFCAVLNGTTQAPAFADYPQVHIAPDLADLQAWLGL